MTEGAARPIRAAAPGIAWPPTILDRYMIAELVGPFSFGLSAFTLIFAATQILASAGSSPTGTPRSES